MKVEMTSNLKQLDTFAKMISKKYSVEVGIFGNHNTRATTNPEVRAPKRGQVNLRRTFKVPSAQTNADVGALHEFGDPSRNIPPRSFLRMPLRVRSKQIVAEASTGLLGLLIAGEIKKALARLGIACENAIQLAFSTHGFNQWAPNLLSTIERKGSNSPLIDTAQLRRSISSRVVGG